jgi:hypothetical protein
MELGQISKPLMMEALYNTLVRDHERILQNGVDNAKVKEALDSLILWFETRENYEYCVKLKQIKECLE